jgi:hypothetical protein
MTLKQVLKASYLNQAGAKKSLENQGYKYNDKLSNNEAKVFEDSQGKPIVAFRGTKATKLKDLRSDFMLGLGLQKYDKRFKDSNALIKQVETHYGQKPTTVSHSLGSALAVHSNPKGVNYTYNRGIGLGDIGKTVPKNTHEYRTSQDLVSGLSHLQRKPHKNVTTFKSQKDPLTAHNLNQLPDELNFQ